jgi:hypothetical protein
MSMMLLLLLPHLPVVSAVPTCISLHTEVVRMPTLLLLLLPVLSAVAITLSECT